MLAVPAPRKPAKRKPEQHELDEFAERYETFALIYGDPLEAVFEIMAKAEQDDDTRLQAAKLLMEHRFPKLKALEGTGAAPPQVIFHINAAPAAPRQVIDITPAPAQLPETGS
jgi:hypothetical protein